jgi:hypothetical protein
MKKNLKSLLSLLLVLVFALQLGPMAAVAEPDIKIKGSEALVYELYIPNPDPEAQGVDKLLKVKAEDEGELLGGKTCSVVLEHEDKESETGKKTVSLPREAGAADLNVLLKDDLIVTPPEGFYISQLYLRGDALETQKPKALPFEADAEATSVKLPAGALGTIDEETEKEIFDQETLSSLSTVDPAIYALVIVLEPIDEEKELTVTQARENDQSEISVKRGDSYTAPDALPDTEAHLFKAWKVVYESGASLILKPGESFKPYADCRVETKWTERLTITANKPEKTEFGVHATDYELSGTLEQGDKIRSVSYEIREAEGGYISVPSNAVILRGTKDVSDQYLISYLPSEVLIDDPDPIEPIELTITANPPVADGMGGAVEDGSHISAGALAEGDTLQQPDVSVQKQADGSYIAVPSNARILHGDIDVTERYSIRYVNSDPYIPPTPDPIKITITANKPVDNGEGCVHNGFNITEGSLAEGDVLKQLSISVPKQDDGSYIAVPSNAVIMRGETDVTDQYDIRYVNSEPYIPPTEKIEITLRSKDRSAEYTGKLITADSYEITKGALAEGDTLELRYDGGSTNVTSSPVVSGIASVVIKDSAGNDVTTSKYQVTLDNENAGKVTVTKHGITLTAISGTVETDGTRVINASECKTKDGSFSNGYHADGLLEGHSLRGSFVRGSGKETFVTSIDASAVQIVDGSNADVTANYDIHTVDGKLTIKVAVKTDVPVVVTTRDMSLVYDGAAHKPDSSICSVSGLLDGDTPYITFQIKQGGSTMDSAVNAGTYTLVPVVNIKTKDGAAVNPNKYKITVNEATLTIKPHDVTFTAVGASKVYDGSPLRNGDISCKNLIDGHTTKKDGVESVKYNVFDAKGNLIVNGVVKVGVYTKKITEVHIYDANGLEVTGNYNVILIDGKLEIAQSSQSQKDAGNGSKGSTGGVKTGDSDDTLFVVLLVASGLLLVSIVAFIILQSQKKRSFAPAPAFEEAYSEPDELVEDWAETKAPILWQKNDPHSWMDADSSDDGRI